MTELLDKLAKLESISSALEMTSKQKSALIDEASDYAIKFVESLSTEKSFDGSYPNLSELKIDGNQKSLAAILSIFQKEVVEKGIKAASGGHMGYIPGGGLYASAVGDYLAAVTNEYAGVTYASPGAVAIENELINWLKKIFNFPENAVGNLSSGGSTANLIAIVVARDKHGVKNEAVRKSVIYLSEHAHHCIKKGIRIAGLQDAIVRTLATDKLGRIDLEELRSLVKTDKAANLNPFLIIASVGTTDTGAIDPLYEIGQLANAENIWYHIDGAYGGFFMLTAEKKQLFKGIELADSLVVDPHKSLFIPYGLGVVLMKNKHDALRSYGSKANYMQDAIDDDELFSPADISPELTKHFRAMRLWLPLQLHGIEPFIACLEEKLILTKLMRSKLIEKGFCVGPEPDLSVSYFWYPSKGVDENEFNQKLMEYIHQDGTVFLSSTLIEDKFVIRIAIVSFRTKLKTIEKCLKMIDLCLEKTKKVFVL